MNHGVATGIAILAIGGISVASVILGVLRREKTGGIGRVPPPHPAALAALADEDYDLVLRGGAWVNGINVTWPSASLLISSDQIELRAYAVEPIRIARAEVTALRWVPGPFGRGLKFRTDSGRLDKVTFWPLGRASRSLRELGWH
jgi:hypothetical protein